MFKRALWILLVALLAVLPAHAQTVPPGFNFGNIPTAGQWAFAWSSKQDTLGFTPLNSAGGSMSGPFITAPSLTSAAGITVTPGVAPTAPNNGDFWSTTAGFYGQINGITVGPFGAAGANQTITPGTGLSSSPSPCNTASCAISLVTPVSVANGGTNCGSLACLASAMGLGTMSTQNAGAVAVTGGAINGTAIGGSSPAAGAFTTLSATTPLGVTSGGLGVATLTANKPVLGNGTSPVVLGSTSGNTTVFATSTGTLTNGHCVKIDASGNYVDAGAACGLPALSADATAYIRTAPATVTISIATPAVVSWTAHGLSVNSPVVFDTTGALPTGITAGTIYYVVTTGFGVNAFEISTTLGGSAVNTTGSQSGTQKAQTGDDAHDCTAATVAKACLTAQFGLNALQSIDSNGHQFTVQLADGDYNEDLTVIGTRSPIEYPGVSALPYLRGNPTTPANVRINATTAGLSLTGATGQLGVDGLTFNTGLIGASVTSYGLLQLYHVNYGAAITLSDIAAVGGTVSLFDSYTVSSSGAFYHWFASNQGVIDASGLTGQTITLAGTPSFVFFAAATDLGFINAGTSITFSGPATGFRFDAVRNGVIYTAAAGVSFFPGDADGSVQSGGQYDDITAVAYLRPGTSTVTGLTTADPTPQVGDMISVTDAVTCVVNTTPTGSGAITCPLVYTGAAWKAIVTNP